jgi:hypothetical protein
MQKYHRLIMTTIIIIEIRIGTDNWKLKRKKFFLKNMKYAVGTDVEAKSVRKSTKNQKI